MATPTARLARDGAALIEASAALREVLLRYERTTKKCLARIEKGDTVVEALSGVRGSIVRPEVTVAMDALEAARHQVRLAMFELGLAEGSSISEIGRALGFSRQLASRLAAEASKR